MSRGRSVEPSHADTQNRAIGEIVTCRDLVHPAASSCISCSYLHGTPYIYSHSSSLCR